MKKITSIILYVLLAISIVSVIPAFVKGDAGVDFMLYWTYILLGISILLAVVMSLVNIGKNPGGSKLALYGILAVAVVLVASYFLSSSDPVAVSGGREMYDNKFGLIATDMGLYTTYVALAVAIIVLVAGEIKNSLK